MSSPSWRRVAVAAVAIALVAPLAACADEGGSAEDALVIYSGRNEELVGPLIEQFEEETGISVEVRYGDTAEMAAQILEEGDNSPADVFFGQDAGALGALAKADRLATLPDDVLALVPEAYRDASPITWVDAESAPFLIIHGGADPMISVEHARRMTDALHVAEVEVVSIEIPAGSHFSVAWWFAAGPWTRTFFSVTLHPDR